MRVLWFSHIPLIQDENGKHFYPGGNWISSLKTLIESEITLGVVFVGEENSIITDENGTTLYQISTKKKNRFSNVIDRWRHNIDSKELIEQSLIVINKFKPDLIQIFGTESSFSNIIKHTNVPIIIHIQAILAPILNSWQIPGFNNITLFRRMDLSLFVRGAGLFHDHQRLKKMVIQERMLFEHCKYFIGRTNWDKAISKLYAPTASYFHCDEVIRASFYNNQWKKNDSKTFIISSTINANIYKGLDIILKTAFLLKETTTLPFIWNIYGIQEKDEYAKIVTDIVETNFYKNNVFLKGKVLENELLNGMLSSNIFVHCSYIDNSPNSVCEAQLIGLPIISTNVGGISSLIKDGENGFLVPSNEPHILANKICELYNNKKDLERISKNAIETAHKRHCKSKITQDLLSIYKSIKNQ